MDGPTTSQVHMTLNHLHREPQSLLIPLEGPKRGVQRVGGGRGFCSSSHYRLYGHNW